MKKRFETDGSSIIDTGKRRGRKRVRPPVDDHPQHPRPLASTPVRKSFSPKRRIFQSFFQRIISSLDAPGTVLLCRLRIRASITNDVRASVNVVETVQSKQSDVGGIGFQQLQPVPSISGTTTCSLGCVAGQAELPRSFQWR